MQDWQLYLSRWDDATIRQYSTNPELVAGQGTTSLITNYEFKDFGSYDLDQTYYYWLESVDYSNQHDNYGPIVVYIPEPEDENNSPIVPLPYGLQQNYPNPFNPSTEISFILDYSADVNLKVFNVQGKLIKTLLSNHHITKEANNGFVWNGKNEKGELCGSGIYFYQLETARENLMKRMLLIK